MLCDEIMPVGCVICTARAMAYASRCGQWFRSAVGMEIMYKIDVVEYSMWCTDLDPPLTQTPLGVRSNNDLTAVFRCAGDNI